MGVLLAITLLSWPVALVLRNRVAVGPDAERREIRVLRALVRSSV